MYFELLYTLVVGVELVVIYFNKLCPLEFELRPFSNSMLSYYTDQFYPKV
jgi:hypothetical protein